MTITALLRDIRAKLSPLSGDLAQADAEAIVQQSLNISRTQLYTDTSININDHDFSMIDSVVKRRRRGEPLQYIFGKAYFYDREFFVNSDVLIPRPDTETLVETVLNTEKGETAYFADIGTGSGIIPAILAAHRTGWAAAAVDISYEALRAAARNISSDPATGRSPSAPAKTGRLPSAPTNIILICCDMLSAIKPQNQVDLIVSNPPYISSVQMKTLDESVINYEPHAALHGGEDGLDYYRMISGRAMMYLKEGGRIYLEIGHGQGESVPQIFREGGWRDIAVIKDLGGRDRGVKIIR
jgi:release factor glutamine methyltransferase